MILKVRFQCDRCPKTADIDNTETKYNFSRCLRELQNRGWRVVVGMMVSSQICPDCQQPDDFDKCA